MSNRENLRRIAALSLVIAFGMSGAAGLANEPKSEEVVAPAPRLVWIEYEPSDNAFTDEGKFNYSYDIVIPAGSENVVFNLQNEWKFTDANNDDVILETEVTLDGDTVNESDGHYALTFSTVKTYTVIIAAKDSTIEDAKITIRFNVTKAQEPEEEKKLTVSYDSLKLGALFEETKVPNTFKYSDDLKLDNGTATAEFVNFWTFRLGKDEITDFELPEGLTVDETSKWYSVEFKNAGSHTFEIKAKDSNGKPYDAPTITLVFNVLAEDKPEETAYSTIDITDDKFGGVFSNEGQPGNTYKYTGKFETDAEGNYTADFSSFWKFVVGNVDAESVTDSASIKEKDGTYTFTAKDFEEHKVTFYAKEHNDPENDAMLTLIFKVDEPEEVVPVVDINSYVRESYFDGDDKTYVYDYKIDSSSTPDDPYTVDFKEFWTFTNPDTGDTLGYIITDNDGKVIKPIDNEKLGATNEYAVTFPKTGEYKLVVKALKDDGTTTYNAPVITLNFDIKSDVPELTIYGDKAEGFNIDGTTCTYELTLDEAGTAKDVEFTKFWQFDLNGKDLNVKDLKFALPEGIEDTGVGYKVSFDEVGEYPYEIKAIKTAADAETETEAVLYDAPVLTLKFIVTEAEPEITVDLTTDETDEFTTDGEKFTFNGGFEETEDDEGNCKFTATFKPFWNFKRGEDAVAYEIYNKDGSAQTVEKDGENGTLAIDFTESGEHTYTVKAVDAEGTPYDNAPSVTLVFDVPEHEELPTVEYDEDVWSKYFTKSEKDENTFIYNDKLEFTAGSSCTARFEPFYSFKLDSLAEGKHLLSSLKITNFECANEPDDILALTFSEEGDYDVVVTSALYEEVIGEDNEKTYKHIKDFDMPAVTLKFHVTKRTPVPVYPDPVFPVDPSTPAPTATPAPTETPAPTDAPTDAPTSAPTTAPDVEMQVSAGGKRLNVRSGAGIGNSIIARLNDGSKVTVLLVEGDWSYIRATVNGNVIEGYVSSQYLKEISTVEPTEPTNARVSTSGSALRLRASASLNAPIITRMPNGSSLKVLETVNGWCRVQFTAANGTVHEGWASSQYITVIA